MPPSVASEERPASVADLRRLENKVDNVVTLLADMKLFEERQAQMNTRLLAVEVKTDSNTRKVDRGIWVGTGLYLAGAFVLWLMLQGVIQITPLKRVVMNPPAVVIDADKDKRT